MNVSRLMPKRSNAARAPKDAFSAIPTPRLTSVELCAGGGGQALGLEHAGFQHTAVVELDRHACNTLRTNRPHWGVLQSDVREFEATRYQGVDLLAGGLPCPPFSRAGKQLGMDDERNLFPAAIRIISEMRPRAIMLENVRGILDSVFDEFRENFRSALSQLGYVMQWQLLNARDFGVPQLRPRVVFVALREPYAEAFSWPIAPILQACPTVGEVLRDLMSSNGWDGANDWAAKANKIAPTIVGGSHKHGGPDLGPTRARREWASLHVDGLGIADSAPGPGFKGLPRLTVRMVARLQGFPDSWMFTGGKTAAYRQVGNAFPPPVAAAVGAQIATALIASDAAKLASAV